jgi:uncharacterized protein YigE (DUF2233 family)
VKIRTLKILVTLFTLALISSTAMSQGLKRRDNPGKQKKEAEVDSLFQNMIDEYCKVRFAKYSIERKFDNAKLNVKNSKDHILKLKYEEKQFIRTRDNFIHKFKEDSAGLTKKGIKQAKTQQWDTLIRSVHQEIMASESMLNGYKKIVDSLQHVLTKTNATFDETLKKTRNYLSKKHGSMSFNLCGINYYIFIADLDSDIVKTHLFRGDGQNLYTLEDVRKSLENQKLKPLMITNAGMFTPNHEPVGLYVEEGKQGNYTLDTLLKDTDENFYLSPNGVFFIDSSNTGHINTTQDFMKLQKEGKLKIKIATQSGPMLLIHGEIHPKFTYGSVNEKIRSGVGLINSSKIVFAITANESNFYEFATLFKDIFDCKDALFLDGAISQMYLNDRKTGYTGGNFGPMISVSRKN